MHQKAEFVGFRNKFTPHICELYQVLNVAEIWRVNITVNSLPYIISPQNKRNYWTKMAMKL